MEREMRIHRRAVEAGLSDGEYFAKAKEVFRKVQKKSKQDALGDPRYLLLCGFLLTLGIKEKEELQNVWRDIDPVLTTSLKPEQIIKDLNKMYIEYGLVQRSS
jgi:hypothetical protein